MRKALFASMLLLLATKSTRVKTGSTPDLELVTYTSRRAHAFDSEAQPHRFENRGEAAQLRITRFR